MVRNKQGRASHARPRIILGEPAVVAQAPAAVRKWGPWQFPSIEHTADDALHVSFHIELDSVLSYGLPVGHAVSRDAGRTWSVVSDEPRDGGLRLPNGDRLRVTSLRSRPLAELELPPALAEVQSSHPRAVFRCYPLEDLPEELRDGWRFARLRAGESEWRQEKAEVRIPGEVRCASEGVLAFSWVYRMKLGPDGALWGLNYGYRAPGRILSPKWEALLLRSLDGGRSWDLWATIPYRGDPAADPYCARRDGFSESALVFPADGSMLCLLRSTDTNGIGPMYVCRSRDGGETWDTPTVFDDRGVWPATVELRNGVTVLSYGRPGLFVRATNDPTGREWTDRVAVVEPGKVQTETCSYSDLFVMGDNRVLIVYSDFHVPGPDGTPRKTILARTVTVEV